jgi:hypothetical protein
VINGRSANRTLASGHFEWQQCALISVIAVASPIFQKRTWLFLRRRAFLSGVSTWLSGKFFGIINDSVRQSRPATQAHSNFL